MSSLFWVVNQHPIIEIDLNNKHLMITKNDNIRLNGCLIFLVKKKNIYNCFINEFPV